jgi:hypothetical protein
MAVREVIHFSIWAQLASLLLFASRSPPKPPSNIHLVIIFLNNASHYAQRRVNRGLA